MSTTIRTAAHLVLALAALAAGAPALAQKGADWRNLTSGAPLRPGVYGRIAVRDAAAPPPVIYPQPMVASEDIGAPREKPVYLYVPPGQVRKWKQNCAKWSACDAPVLFVRVDDSPSRWGQWKQLRETQVAWQDRD
ncbi:hypothetical protein WG902_10220 [Ramlibacter sp. PS3R-8]|uniref:hypothetical protein n=1 Tax=Ramlibacter sp. PS3R-8 TaxID=3133437 RepID=UPI0030A3369A